MQRSALLTLTPASLDRLKTPDDLSAWLQTELQFSGLQARVKADPPKKIVWADREVEQPARWTVNLAGPDKGIAAEYFVGNRFVKVDTLDATPIGALTRMHMAIGVNVFWVLLSDTIAGGLIVLSITGLLLWTRMHVIKLGAVTVSTSALLASIWFFWSSI